MDPQRFIATVVGAIGMVLLLIYGKPILLPFVIAVLAAYLITAFADRLRDLLPEIFPGWVTRLLATLVLGVGVLVVLEVLAHNLQQVVEAAPRYENNLTNVVRNWAAALGIERLPSVDWVLSRTLDRLDIQGLIGAVVGSVTSIVGNGFLVVLYAAFLLLERGSLRRKWLLMHASEAERLRHDATIVEIGVRVRRYVFLKTVLSVIVAVGSWAIMELIGIDFASFWALLIFALNFIPYIGSPIAVAFPVLLSLVQFGDLPTFLITAVTLTAIQMLVGSIIEPRLMGRSLNLSPVIILLSLALWGSLWGPVGALFSVPIMVILTIIMSQFPSTRPFAILLSRDGDV
ncbi:AI-2E family transporter [Ectothiorhodospiraceae bacterium WFHF3C12]|nr:AI-2E family transporter [Ectothiorhodospiraceae bacterium WFHF3C12]